MIVDIILLFVFGGWLIGKLAQNLIKDEEDYLDENPLDDYKESPTVINNYTVNIQNNLNITDEQLKKLKS